VLNAPRPAAIAVVALTLAGCGISNPYQSDRRATSSTTTTTPATSTTVSTASRPPGRLHEHDGPPTRATGPVSHAALTSTPQQALQRYGTLYVDWSASVLPAHARQLAALSVGQARQSALASAANARALQRYQVSNSGSVVAIAPGIGAQRGKWAVVTDEQTTGTGPYLGLPITSHVTWATLQRLKGGYVIASWAPGS